ncbi:MAG: hypothetical protein J1F36_04060 [Clostridiales bacterium]|nr:hypothetical protein [Clostridiales bacterium]
MLYFVIALLLLISFVILYKVFLPVGEPNMELTGVMTGDELKAKIVDLAANMNSVPTSDSSLSSHLIRTTIQKTYKRLSKRVGHKKCLDFENWIYDNYYKLAEIMAEQKKLTTIYNKLPGYKNLPRIFCIAQLIVKGSGGAVTADTIKECTNAFNEILPLKFNEVIMLPAAINLALLEYIAIFCSRSNVINEKFDAAMNDIRRGNIDISLLNYNSYAYAFTKYADGELLKRFDALSSNNGISAYKRADNFLSACVRYTGAVSSAIKSIYSLSAILTDKFCLQLCPLNNYLEHSKDIVYSDCTDATKYVYLQRIAKKAKNKNEISFAGEIVHKAISEGKDIAHYILPRPLGKFALIVYILIIVGYTISNCVTVLMYLPQFKWAAAIIFTPISLNLVLMFVTSINVRVFSRRYMPRINLEKGVSTMIVFPVLVFDEKEVDEMVDNLLTVSYANNNEIFSYGLLIDLPASKNEFYSEADERIIKRAVERISALGSRYNLFIRKRTKAAGEKYQGWEKKRGAILDLNNLIITNEKSAFEVVTGDSYKVKYVITLDSDTMINCAYELVEIMEHPFNAGKAVVALNVKSAPSALRTPFAEVMSDSVGLNNYSNFIADANYDIFGSGNYTGKGIYRVKEFTDKVGDVFMENRVLSHDFVEGAIAGCGSSGESALDSYPETFSSYLSRNIRWLRGDYQLLPFLCTRIRDGKGRFMRNPVSIIGRMHILNNILLGLIPLSSALLLVLSLFTSSPVWLTAVAFSLNIFIFLGTFRLIFFKPKKVWYELLRQLLMVACLPVIAYNYTKAILITLYRLIVKKNLLDWSVFAHSNGKVSFLPNIIASAVYIVFAAFISFKPTFIVMAALFAFGILLAELLSKRFDKKEILTAEDESKLKKIAADTWIFFEKQLREENNFLPFDNYQEEGDIGYAPRTSPTDIGFMITSLVCAYKMEFINDNDFTFYAGKILSSIEGADKWKGNLYNWVDIYSLKRLNGYVSAVDSGNLLASLILLRNVSSGEIAKRADALIIATDLGAFFDEDRGLLFIGYDNDGKSFDSNHYDMLGSESMLTYLIGIGTGKLKSSCFRNLSGRCVRYKGVSLYSWTGGAFEYMMSALYFKYCKGGLLHSSAKVVLKANKLYAKRSGLPFWGTSESQYNAVDGSGNYQYKAFGVPNIALSNEKRKAVASPYASMLFLPFFPREVAVNLNKIYEHDLKGEEGLYEAYDDGVIKTYMSHHQGMILAALCNYFYDDAIIKSMASPDMRAASLLITMSDIPKASKKHDYEPLPVGDLRIEPVKELSPPAINLMTGGKYSVLIDGSGNGYSYYDGRYVSRYYNYSGGLKLYLNIAGKRTDLQKQTAYFYDGKTEFVFNNGKCEIKQVASVLPNMDGEVRSIQIKNLTAGQLNLNIESYMEVALAPLYEDLAHKTFSGMFVTTANDDNLEAVTAKRGNLILAHYFDEVATYQSNRSNFFGRGRGDDFGRVLDPIVSGNVSLSLAPYEMHVLQMYNIVSEDYDRLKKQVSLTKRAGFYEKINAANSLISKGFGISKKMCSVMSKLLYDAAPNLVDGELPLIYIESNVVTERIKSKIKMLNRLGLWGLKVRIAFVYYGDGFIRERLYEALEPLLGDNCYLTLIDKEQNKAEAVLALKSATNIDELTHTEIKTRKSVDAVPFPRAQLPKLEYSYRLGMGGFIESAYALENSLPPRPWSNIIANEHFGTLITESGGGYTYYTNSRENKLTEWSNDPIGDACSEGIVLFEEGISWSCAKKPISVDADYQAIHGLGYSEFRCNYNGFYSRLREFINGNTKYYEVTLTSNMNFERRVEAMFFVSPVLGDFAFKTRHNLVCEFDGKLTVKNLYNNSTFIMGADKEVSNYVCHKQSFTDKFDKIFLPKSDLGYEFMPAISVKLDIQPKGTTKAVFYLSADGKVKSNEAEILRQAKEYYSSLSCLSLSTGNPAIDYIAKWLPYQIMTSRFWGRTGFYQAGGAIGFRDQLQDCLGVLYVNPELVKKHILVCAAHQFEAGDVQHWWHEPRTGVRTKISDDRLFLPLITAEYIEFTGDNNILYERVPYLEDVKIIGKDYYGSPNQTVKSGTILEHCLKAIKASARLGENGLVLMGGGDWNDAMDKVGINGKGTTVWGSMFLYLVVDRFMPYVKNRKPFYALKDRLKEAINNAWDGEWFTRAYCDDGTVLGGKSSKECNIDLITQSFAVLSGVASEQRGKLALFSAANKLVDHQNGIIKLLTPPLKDIKAGYICDYPPGVRENGGQYTHGAVWYIMSLFAIGEIEYAYSLLNMINPINHSKSKSAVLKYEVEPYVISADVYSQPAGKGGWSWYTGAAAWYYHVIVKYLFGISFNGSTISVSPKMPKSLKEASFSVRRGDITVYFKIDNSELSGEWQIYVGGRGYNTNSIAITETLDKKEIIVRRDK